MSDVMLTLAQAAAALNLPAPENGAVSFSGVSTDSRQIKAGELFVALKGPNFDGHRFIGQVREAGAVAALVSESVDDPLPQIRVADTRIALGQLAAAWRREFNGPVLGITGSNGKTTVKEMVAAIMARRGPVWATQGNLNNDIGVPLTLFRLRPAEHKSAVIEMGANHVGEIGYLTRIVRPDVAVVCNAAKAHIGEFGSLEAVAQTKGEIWQGLAEQGVAVINRDDAFADYWLGLVAGRTCITFGSGGEAQVRLVSGSIKAVMAQGRFNNSFEMETPAGKATVALQLAGAHNVMNALAATAVTLAVGVELQEICAGLAAVAPVKGRLHPLEGVGGQLLIDDTYNANPQSFSAAIAVLTQLQGETVLVLGDMAELGDEAAALHFQVGEEARRQGVKQLYATGPLSREAVNAFGDGGHWFEERSTLTEALAGAMRSVPAHSQAVLVKGSRSARMDEVVQGLLEAGGGAGGHKPMAAVSAPIGRC